MLKHRVIPCLLLKNGGLVKTVKFSNPKYVGDPINAIKIFNDKEVDELMVLDITASKENRAPNFSLIEQFAGECYMPLCYGGGVQSPDHAKRLFEIGVEKVSVQSVAINHLAMIENIANKCGSQSLLVSIDVKKNWLGKYELYSAALGKSIKTDWKQFLKDVVSAGAGEILLNSVDKDGTMEGMDFELIKTATSQVNVPMVVAGGVGSLNHIKTAVDCGASAVSVGSFFVFHGPHRAVLITYPRYQELEELLK